MQRLLTLTIILFLTASVFAATPEWSQWRGPNRDGLSADTGLLQEWPPGGPALIWKSTNLGAGYSSLSASATRLFTMG